MSYQVLARKWRPTQFDEVVGQPHVVKALVNALDQDRVHHAFLFTGTRGVGKTTLARIFAKALNCEKGVSAHPCDECSACIAVAEGRFIDLIEVDAASRTKVDDTRELLENVQYAPSQGRYKVYLIDEVHMLSTHSFNALLKTLEEPPSHVKFLLATTDPQKLPMTVLSRCIQFSLNAIELGAIEKQLCMILDNEKIDYEEEAIGLLARAADGSMRDGLSLLDQAIAYSDKQLDEAGVRNMLGLIEGQSIVDILDALALHDAQKLMESVARLVHAAQSLKTVLDDLLSYLHTLALYQFAPEATKSKAIEQAQLGRLAACFAPETLQLYYQIVLNGKRDFAFAPDPRTGFEMILLRLLAFKPQGLAAKSKQPNSKPSRDQGENPSQLNSNEAKMPSVATNKAAQQVAEEVEEFLENGLNNETLQQHLHKASSLVRNEVKSPLPVDDELESEQSRTEINTEHAIVINQILNNIDDWSDFVHKLELGGMARQLMMHTMPTTYEDNVIGLQVDELYTNLHNKERLKQVNQAVQKISGQEITVEFTFGNAGEQTPAMILAGRKRAELEEMRQDFKQDKNVQTLVSMFDASIEDSSIKPIKFD